MNFNGLKLSLKSISQITLTALLFIFLTPARGEKSASPPRQKEYRELVALFDTLEKKEISIETLKNLFYLNEKEGTKLEFNARHLTGYKDIGELSFYLSFTQYKNEILYLSITCPRNKYSHLKPWLKDHPALKKRYHKLFSKKKKADDYLFQKRNPKIEKKYYQNFTRYYGKLEKVKLTGEHKDAYEALLYPHTFHTFGHMCGIAGVSPYARDMFEKLTKLENPKIYRNILRGYNSSAKAYALEGLGRLFQGGYSFTAEDKRLLLLTKNADYNINSCSGCLHYTESINELYLLFSEALSKGAPVF